MNGAKRGKPAVILLLGKGIEVNVEAVVGIVGTKPLHIRWLNMDDGIIEVFYDRVCKEPCSPQATFRAVDGAMPLEKFDSAMFHLNPVVPSPKMDASDEIRIYNPVRKALERKEAREYLDPELEKLLALLADCM